MGWDYGYGKLENEIIDLFCSVEPDFNKAEELIEAGADLNAKGKEEDENILSEILMGYWSLQSDNKCDACKECDDETCHNCEHNIVLTFNIGQSMCDTIHFFLEHGFDVNKNGGSFGAQCLHALAFATFDRYIIDATKILLDSGATNCPVYPTADEDETPWDFIAMEGNYQSTANHNYALANIFEAVYQIYQAIDVGRPYGGIDSYEAAIGKKVMKVLAEKNGEKPIFYKIDLPEYKKENCFNNSLYFIFEDCFLVATEYAEFWVDTVLPDVELVDVSEFFYDIIGSEIKSFTYSNRDIIKGINRYGQPITVIEMESGKRIKFSINFGEVQKEGRAAFFELEK